jgi:hypothetical protein
MVVFDWGRLRLRLSSTEVIFQDQIHLDNKPTGRWFYPIPESECMCFIEVLNWNYISELQFEIWNFSTVTSPWSWPISIWSCENLNKLIYFQIEIISQMSQRKGINCLNSSKLIKDHFLYVMFLSKWFFVVARFNGFLFISISTSIIFTFQIDSLINFACDGS